MWSDKGEDQGLAHVLQRKTWSSEKTSIIMIQVLAVPASTSPLQVLLKMATLNMGSIQISWQYSWDLFTSLMISLAKLTKRNAKFQWNAKKNTNKMLSESLIKKIDMVGPYKLVLYRVSQKKKFPSPCTFSNLELNLMMNGQRPWTHCGKKYHWIFND